MHCRVLWLAAAWMAACGGMMAGEVRGDERPNILFFITDDQSARHSGAYGDPAVHTPAMDRIAREGVRFTRAFAAAPSCTPSRSATLTGQSIWRLEQGALLFGALPARFDVFPLMLEQAGYFVGATGKTWSPGNLRAGGRDRDPTGTRYFNYRNDRNKRYDPPLPDYWANDYAANFQDFLNKRPADRPFLFWAGTIQPHLPWVEGLGQEAGKRPEDANLPASLPRHPVVLNEMIDYYGEIEYADSHLGRMVRMLEDAGELDRTMIIVTSDHGIALPRAKCNLYDAGTHVPLAVRYPPMIRSGRVVEDLVNLIDLAPTILEAAGESVPRAMTGRSLMPLLKTDASGWIDPSRDFVALAFERHTWTRPEGVGYPMRALRTADYLYIRNYEPDRWPAGDPDFESPHQGTLGDADACVTKTFLIEHKDDPQIAPYYELAFGKRPAEELYDVREDPDQLYNLAEDPVHARTLATMRGRLHQHLADTGDPRLRGEAKWDGYPYYFQDYWKRAKYR